MHEKGDNGARRELADEKARQLEAARKQAEEAERQALQLANDIKRKVRCNVP